MSSKMIIRTRARLGRRQLNLMKINKYVPKMRYDMPEKIGGVFKYTFKEVTNEPLIENEKEDR